MTDSTYISRQQFEEAARLFDLIGDLRDQLSRATTMQAKLVIYRRIQETTRDRRKMLGMES